MTSYRTTHTGETGRLHLTKILRRNITCHIRLDLHTYQCHHLVGIADKGLKECICLVATYIVDEEKEEEIEEIADAEDSHSC